MKTKQRQLSWTPIRRGPLYCSAACGAGCTHAQYLAVKRHGEKMRKAMRNPSDWEVHLHENLQWFVRLRHVRWRGLTVSPGYMNEPRYHAMLSDEKNGSGTPAIWFDRKNFDSPQAAVDHRLKIFKGYAANINQIVESITETISGKR